MTMSGYVALLGHKLPLQNSDCALLYCTLENNAGWEFRNSRGLAVPVTARTASSVAATAMSAQSRELRAEVASIG